MSENKSFSTAVPAVQISDRGLNVPDEADILSGRLADFSAALGGAMSTSLSSPQGQLASSESAIIVIKTISCCISLTRSTLTFPVVAFRMQ
ncbi:hypothetical protein BHJ80_11390 [Escherichia coli]|nr:hypothetical protein BHJ80_11390 [Escherichia coli]